MNWFKKISSFNIRFNDEIEQDIKEITKYVLNYYLEENTELFVMNPWVFSDPYQNTQRKVNIVVFPTKQGNQIAYYNGDSQTISIFPHNLQTDVKNKNLLFNAFEYAIKHEVAHAIDPKLRIEKPIEGEGYEYYSSPAEFDAYSKQITEHLKQYIKENPENKNTIEKWLRNDTLSADNPLTIYSEILQFWAQSDYENKTNYIRKLKQRIYNEVIKEEENNVSEN